MTLTLALINQHFKSKTCFFYQILEPFISGRSYLLFYICILYQFHWNEMRKRIYISVKQIVCPNFFVPQANLECGFNRLRERMQVKQSNVVTNSVHRSIKMKKFGSSSWFWQDGNFVLFMLWSMFAIGVFFTWGLLANLKL